MFIGHLISLFASVSIAFAAVAVPAAESAVQDEAITVPGTIKFPTLNSLVATFPVGGVAHTFTGACLLPLASLITAATLTFNDELQLTGFQSLHGIEGPIVVDVDLDSGVHLSWNLLPPTFAPIPISGNGTWSSS